MLDCINGVSQKRLSHSATSVGRVHAKTELEAMDYLLEQIKAVLALT